MGEQETRSRVRALPRAGLPRRTVLPFDAFVYVKTWERNIHAEIALVTGGCVLSSMLHDGRNQWLRAGAEVVLHGLVMRADLNGKTGRVQGPLLGNRRWPVCIDEETVKVRPDNLLPARMASELAGGTFTKEPELHAPIALLRKELNTFLQQHMQHFADWWTSKSIDTRHKLLRAACPGIHEGNLNFEETLVPDLNLGLLAEGECFHARKGGCDHGLPLRLLHDMHISASMEPRKLQHVDYRMVWNLNSVGSLQSPACYGPHGAVHGGDGYCRLLRPSPLDDDLRGRIDKDEVC